MLVLVNNLGIPCACARSKIINLSVCCRYYHPLPDLKHFGIMASLNKMLTAKHTCPQQQVVVIE